MNKKENHIEQDVPKGYFDSLTDQIMSRVAADEASFLKNDKLKQLPFQTPEGYFEGLADNLIEKTSQKEAKVVQLWQRNVFKYAASIILLAGAFFLLTQVSQNNGSLDLLSELSDEEIIEYLSTDDVAIQVMIDQTEVMDDVLSELMADVAYDYSDLIDYEQEDFFFEQ